MRVLALAALLALAPAPAVSTQPDSCRPTLADYEALREGDRFAAVVARLGCRGEKATGMTIGERRRATYTWRGTGSFGANLVLTFANGKLTGKSQLGLE